MLNINSRNHHLVVVKIAGIRFSNFSWFLGGRMTGGIRDLVVLKDPLVIYIKDPY